MTTDIMHWLGSSLILIAVLGIVGETARIAWTHGNPDDSPAWRLMRLSLTAAIGLIAFALT